MKKFSKILKIIVVILFVGFVGIQFIRPDRTNPPVIPELALEAHVHLPENVKMILSRSCADCHSHHTVFPWYSQIAPASWFLADHVSHGRSHLNFSEWGKLENSRKIRRLEEICEQVESREMPLASYLWIHRDAQMSDEEIKIICDWTQSESEKIPVETK